MPPCSRSVVSDVFTVLVAVLLLVLAFGGSWKRLRGAKKPRAGVDVLDTGRCCDCVVSVNNDEKKKQK